MNTNELYQQDRLYHQLLLEYASTKHEPFLTFNQWLPTVGYGFQVLDKTFDNFDDAWADMQCTSSKENVGYTIVKLKEK